MEFLASRRFWAYLGLALMGLAGVALFWMPPAPTPLNWLVDVCAFAVTFFGGLAIISQFVLPVQTTDERWLAYQHFLNYVFGAHGPITFVKDGQLVARKEELRRVGFGLALVDASSAIVLEREFASPSWVEMFGRSPGGPSGEEAPPLIRAAGPGIVFIAPGERIVATLDLRRQSRAARAHALTRDGIEVSANVSVTFGLDPDPDRQGQPGRLESTDEPVERNRPAYTFNATSAFRAVYGTALGEKQPVEWTELPVMIAVEKFRDLLAECRLDELFQPTVSGVYPLGDLGARVTQALKESPVLRERGIIAYGAGIGRFNMPREVIHQRVRSWQARWQKASIQQAAAGDRQTDMILNRWRARAQEQIVRDVQTLLRSATTPMEKKALALILTNALQYAATDPATRKLLPSETLRTLRSMREWLE